MILPPGQLEIVGRIPERHPGLRLTIDHTAIPSGAKDEAAFRHWPGLLALAKRPSVGVKVKSLPTYTPQPLSVPQPARLHPA